MAFDVMAVIEREIARETAWFGEPEREFEERRITGQRHQGNQRHVRALG